MDQATAGDQPETRVSKPTVYSIDPPFSRDLDDAVAVVRTDGGWTVDVCVPDVPALVSIGDDMDVRSMDRVNTRYSGAFMKTPLLSDDLVDALSLNPRRDTPMCWFRIELDPTLAIAGLEIRRITHRTTDRLTYLEADEALERPRDRAHAEITAMWDLASALHARRRARTGAAFDPGNNLYTTEEGILAELGEKDSHRSHLIVMELMILANEALAAHAHARSIPVIYRNHVPRDASSGLRGDVVREMQAIEGIDPEEAAGRLRKLNARIGPATFGTRAEGHWGLDVATYAWFTSPLRRACDIVNLRALVHGISHDDLEARAERIDQATREAREASSRHHGMRSRAVIARLVKEDDRPGLQEWDVHTIVRACAETGATGAAVESEIRERLARGAVSGKDIEAVLCAPAAIVGDALKEDVVAWLVGDAQRQLVLARDMHVRQRIARIPTKAGGEPDLVAAMRDVAGVIGFQLPDGWAGATEAATVADPVVDHPNPKGALLEMATARKAAVGFEQVARVGPSHEPRFTIEAVWKRGEVEIRRSASASSVKIATRAVAYEILQLLMAEPEAEQDKPRRIPDKPAKNVLLEHAAKNGGRVEFDDPVRSGPPHAPRFAVTARYHGKGGIRSGSGSGATRKEAERHAAEEILKTLR